MALLSGETEGDAFLEAEDLQNAQREIGFRNKAFGSWALMRSTMSAENRKLRSVERKRKNLATEEKRLEKVQRLRQFARRMLVWSR